MRLAAWMLVAIAAAATFWFGAVAERLIPPPSNGVVMQDHYYTIAMARYCFPIALFALVNSAAALCLAGRPRPGALWLVLAGASLAMAFMAWHYWGEAADLSRRTPDYGEAFARDYRVRLTVSRVLFWSSIAGTALGWIAWLVQRRRGPRAAI